MLETTEFNISCRFGKIGAVVLVSASEKIRRKQKTDNLLAAVGKKFTQLDDTGNDIGKIVLIPGI